MLNKMEDRELLKKLNNLKTIKPDDNWRKNYRQVLHSQISAGRLEDSTVSNISVIWDNIRPKQILADVVKPVWAMTLVCILILAAGIGSVYGSKNSKPGDSLYIAKIISEKAQQAMTFNETDKAKLGLEFAANRAKEITQVLEESKEPGEQKSEKVERLSQNFKNEISQVKTRLGAIKAVKGQNQEDEAQVFGANLEKTNQRMEIAEPVKPEVKQEKVGAPKPAAENQAAVNATSTAAGMASSQQAGEAGKILEEAEKLFAEKNYNGTIDKLEEVNKVINQAAGDAESPSASSGQAGQVKGESEAATSTSDAK